MKSGTRKSQWPHVAASRAPDTKTANLQTQSRQSTGRGHMNLCDLAISDGETDPEDLPGLS
ncbi:MAG: hypothetical protein V3T48_11390, partial [Vicinamibacterales bacterium]